LGYLDQLFDYLGEQDFRMYRMASGLAPYATHPDLPQFWGQVDECAADLAQLGSRARQMGLRLSFHPSQHIVLNAPDDDLAARSAADVVLQAGILEAMALDDEAVVVLHVGGVYRDLLKSRERFARQFEKLPLVAQRRLVLENDDGRFSVQDVLWLHERVGVRVVFDVHHHRVHNPDAIPASEAALACLRTWASWAARPKLHFSSPRTDWGFRYGSKHGRRRPNWASHSEFADPFAFIAFYRDLADMGPDVMLEAKAKDVAVVQLRHDLQRYAPDLAELFATSGGRGSSKEAPSRLGDRTDWPKADASSA
jgi:UV DNA damage endonuclease